MNCHISLGRSTLDKVTANAFEGLAGLLNDCRPRLVSGALCSVYHIYVDASFAENRYSGVGGVLLDMYGTMLNFFSVRIQPETLSLLQGSRKTIIQELEMLAVVIAVTLWLETTKESKVVVFTDSESVRGSVLKSWSANVSSDKLLSRLFLLEQAMSYPLWFERVPSQNNVADSFSREEVQSAGQLRADKVEVESVLRSAAITWGGSARPEMR